LPFQIIALSNIVLDFSTPNGMNIVPSTEKWSRERTRMLYEYIWALECKN